MVECTESSIQNAVFFASRGGSYAVVLMMRSDTSLLVKDPSVLGGNESSRPGSDSKGLYKSRKE